MVTMFRHKVGTVTIGYYASLLLTVAFISERSEERDNLLGSFLNEAKKETTCLAHF